MPADAPKAWANVCPSAAGGCTAHSLQQNQEQSILMNKVPYDKTKIIFKSLF